MYHQMMVTAGQLYRLSRELRDVALSATADPGQERPPLGLVTVTDDIVRHGETTVSEIVARTGLAQSLVSKSVAQLRQAGVVQTHTDRNDRRRNRISITDATRSGIFVERGERTITHALRRRLPNLPAEQIIKIERLLEELVVRWPSRPDHQIPGNSSPTRRG
ncbi:MAG TPA: MarR family transcriptional regulator [Nakamurella sp.]|nr:MarR family transcriptional regulator [Nakamurella sp.]